ncbi:MAG: hypothetical protein M0R73_04305 [Dehalococcoidia bacterium]|nr:hypothetical protein [Dehalococcoidia bacterium]
MDTLTLALFLVGLALFIVGDVLWLLRNTFDRPMNVRVTGGLVASGVALISLGLLFLVLTSE